MFNEAGEVFGVFHREYSDKYGGYLVTPFSAFRQQRVSIEKMLTGTPADKLITAAHGCFDDRGVLVELIYSFNSLGPDRQHLSFKLQDRVYSETWISEANCTDL